MDVIYKCPKHDSKKKKNKHVEGNKLWINKYIHIIHCMYGLFELVDTIGYISFIKQTYVLNLNFKAIILNF